MTTADHGGAARDEHAPDTHEQAFEILEQIELLNQVLSGEVDPLELEQPRCPLEQRASDLRERIVSSEDPNDPELVVAVFDEIVRIHGEITADLGRLEERVKDIKGRQRSRGDSPEW